MSTTTTPYGVIVTETEDYISFRLPSWLTVDERARIKVALDEWWAADVVNSSGECAVISAELHRAWCNLHNNDDDGPGYCTRQSEPVEGFGLDVSENDVVVWHPMRPGQERRPFTADEARAIAAELVRAAELVEAEGGKPKA